MSAATNTNLLAELHHADHIIKVMLNAMTPAQKSKCAAQLEADGVSPDGMTRAHERAAVIQAANAAPSIDSGEAHTKGTESAHVIALSIATGAGAAEQLHEIEGHAVDVQIRAVRQQLGDIESQSLAGQALCEICFDELDRLVDATQAPAVSGAVVRLDALIKATYRNAVLVQESIENIGALLLEGGAA